MKYSKEDTLKVSRYLAIVNLYQKEKSQEKALPYILLGIDLAGRLKRDKQLAQLYRNYGSYYQSQADYHSAIGKFLQSLEVEKKINNLEGQALSYDKIAVCNMEEKNYAAVISNYQNELVIVQKQKDTLRIVDVLISLWKVHAKKIDALQASTEYMTQVITIVNSAVRDTLVGTLFKKMGDFYYDELNFIKSFEYLNRASKVHEALGNQLALSQDFHKMGSIYEQTGNYQQNLECAQKVLDLRSQLGNKSNIGLAESNVGWCYYLIKEYDLALKHVYKAIEIFSETKDDYNLAYPYGNLSLIYNQLGEYEKAISYAQREKDIFLKAKDDPGGLAEANNSIGLAYIGLQKYKEAIHSLNEGLKSAIEVNYAIEIRNSYAGLALAYNYLDDYKKAYEYQARLMQWRDSLFDQVSAEKINSLNFNMANEIHQKEIEVLSKDALLSEAELNHQRTIAYSAIAGLVLILLLTFFVYRGYDQKKKASLRLAQVNIEINTQKKELEEKNKNITDSINYAKFIQDAILPSEDVMIKTFVDSFVFYKPKDIVSGDFYWMRQKDNKLLFAVVDCTGHGVPGAFVSIIGNNGLDRAVNEFNLTKPSDILGKLNELVEESFSQQTHTSQIKDGMDIALCCYNVDTRILEFAGANNPLYYFEDGRFIEIKGDSQPIGSFDKRHEFTNHTIPLTGTTNLYIFSDGYADQFGGQAKKKLKLKQFKQLISSIQVDTMKVQKNKLDTFFTNWIEDMEQVDDICIVGVKL